MNACFECLQRSFTDALVAASHHVDLSRNLSLTNPSAIPNSVTDTLSESATTRALQFSGASATTAIPICLHDERYPKRLADDVDAPPIIWIVGETSRLTDLANRPTYALIGPRHANESQRALAASTITTLDKTEPLLVTTLRLGVDSAAARVARRQEQTKVLAIAAGDPSIAYPRSMQHLHDQLRRDHAVISVTPPGAPPPLSTAHAESRLQLRLLDVLIAIDPPDEPNRHTRVAFTIAAARQRGTPITSLSGTFSDDPEALRRALASAPNN